MFFLKKQRINRQTQIDDSHEQQNTGYNLAPEILTISQDPSDPYEVQFDDPTWKRHLPSMKPLGLSVILNTCNPQTEEKYSDFYQYWLEPSVMSSNTVYVT